MASVFSKELKLMKNEPLGWDDWLARGFRDCRVEFGAWAEEEYTGSGTMD